MTLALVAAAVWLVTAAVLAVLIVVGICRDAARGDAQVIEPAPESAPTPLPFTSDLNAMGERADRLWLVPDEPCRVIAFPRDRGSAA